MRTYVVRNFYNNMVSSIDDRVWYAQHYGPYCTIKIAIKYKACWIILADGARLRNYNL